jgi:3-keto-5-aminohexanoate cleavage enzyme
MARVDFSKYKDLPPTGVQPFSNLTMDMSGHPKWDIPNKIAIIVAPTGLFFTREQNPNQPYTADEIIKESIESVEAGACSVHVHVREDNGFPSTNRKLTEKVVRALRDRFGQNVHIDGEAVEGSSFEQMMEPIVADYYESAAVNCQATFMGETLIYLPPPTCKAAAEVIQAYGKKVIMSVYNPGDIDNAYRWLIQTGIVKPPFLWGVVLGMPGGSPMWDTYGMVETLMHTLRRISDIDKAEHPFIVVTASGRASFYLINLAILLGCHVRVGKEDTIYKLPHSDELIVSNKEVVEQTVALARLLGREPMTAEEYRKAIGLIKA